MLIELAGKFAGTKNTHKRTLVFVHFQEKKKGCGDQNTLLIIRNRPVKS